MRPARLAGALAAASLLLAACAQRPAIQVDPLPDLPRESYAATASLSWMQVMSMLREVPPVSAAFKLEDERYFVVTRPWVEEMHRWFVGFLRQQLDSGSVEEFLRDRPRKVALMLESLAELDVQRNHAVKGQALVGMMSVECGRIATQVPVDGHLCYYVVFGAPDGFHVLDPVTGRIDALRDFPWRDDARLLSF